MAKLAKKYSGMAVVTVSELNEKFADDKNGHRPVILTAIAGKIPNRNILSGTVAGNAGLAPGRTYLTQCTEGEYDSTENPSTGKPYGRRFNWTVLQEVAFADIISSPKALGQPEVFDVEVVVAEAEVNAEN